MNDNMFLIVFGLFVIGVVFYMFSPKLMTKPTPVTQMTLIPTPTPIPTIPIETTIPIDEKVEQFKVGDYVDMKALKKVTDRFPKFMSW